MSPRRTTLESIAQPAALAMAFGAVRGRSPVAGVDRVTPESYGESLDRRVAELSRSILDGTWRASPLLRVSRPKTSGGVRRLGIPTVEDRIVIEAVRSALEPEIEPLLGAAAFAYRPGRSARRAVEAVQRRIASGASWVALADIRDFFDSIPISHVVAGLGELGVEAGIADLARRLLLSQATRRDRDPTRARGLAQGSSLSPVLSNLSLMRFDRRIGAAGFELVRYSDNLCVLAKSRESAAEALAVVQREIRRLDLALKESATRVVEVAEGFLWLGFWIGPDGGRVSDGAVESLSARAEAAGAGLSGAELRARLLPIVRGWVQYFDAPLPPGAQLGPHDSLLRALLAECGGSQAPAASPSPGPAEIDGGVDPWDEGDGGVADGTEAQGDVVSSLLDEAEALAMAGDFVRAETAYESAQAAARTDREPLEAAVRAAPAEVDGEAIDAFVGLFLARQECFESAPVDGSARRNFLVQERAPSDADVRAHLCGERALAVRPRHGDGTSTLGVIDVDAADPAGPGRLAVEAYTDALVSIARAWSIEVIIERTGGRGTHVWLPLDEPISADTLSRILDRWLFVAGSPAPGIRIERLPGPDDAPDLHAQSMTLPLGVHVETRVRSTAAWTSGTAIELNLQGIFAGRANPIDRLPPPASPPAAEASPGHRTPEISPPRARDEAAGWAAHGPGVDRIMTGCAILRDLAAKADAVGHLDHAERLSLLYSFGHLGAPGASAIHTIIGRCRNYDRRETDRQVARLSGLPIGCTRLREKHATEKTLPLCNCDFGRVRQRGGYPTPLLHIGGFRRAWRDELRGRRTVERRHAAGAEGVVVQTEPVEEVHRAETPSARDSVEWGAVVGTAPPHTWA